MVVSSSAMEIVVLVGTLSMIAGFLIADRYHDHRDINELQKEITEKIIGASLLFSHQCYYLVQVLWTKIFG